ncbi:sensor domain-containing diguanylate cyclase [Lacticaseibacillus hulanensis]|uniref:sensor domain-containing diguanylate cyclase n=1 Tax=Lacticaseibacillus hulanensis TaxID=2493111 RepID=UPI0013E311B6|nr:diguanylate cyclase [Lacticaseibacillus hulanensis]
MVSGSALWDISVTEAMVAFFFTAGFVAVYTYAWHRGQTLKSATYRFIWRAAVVALTMVVTTLMAFDAHAGRIAPIFNVVALFVVTYQLFDDGVTNVEYLLRNLGVVLVWFAYHQGNWNDGGFMVSLLVLVLVLPIIWWQHDTVHYQFGAFMAVQVTIGTAFWLTVPGHIGAVNLDYAKRLFAIGMFLIMDALAYIYSAALHREEVQRRTMTRLANVDTLTNAKTYSMYQREVSDYFAAARASETPLTLAALDIDRFKQVNDHYGHLAGNAVLVGVASLLDEILAKKGLPYQLYRTGGEEFNIVFPGNTPGEVVPVVEACMGAVRNNPFIFHKQRIEVTISVGVTSVMPSDRSIDDTYKRADDNLYRSKRNGRDTLTVAGHSSKRRRDRTMIATYAFYVQPILCVEDGSVAGAEIRTQYFDHDFDRWRHNVDFRPDVQSLRSILARGVETSSWPSLNVNLTATELANSAVVDMLIDFKDKSQRLQALTVELEQGLPLTDFIPISRRLHHAGIHIVLDRLGGDGSQKVVAPLFDYVDGLKLTLEVIPNRDDNLVVTQRIRLWSSIAQQHNLKLIVTDVERNTDVEAATQAHAFAMQGFYFGRPNLL